MTRFARYTAYKCRHCRADCINLTGSDPARFIECCDCNRLPDLHQLPALEVSPQVGADD